jgi:K+-transporting ATPase ATPase C chain
MSDFLSAFRPALVLVALFTLLLGVGYPLAILGIGQAVFPHQANGSLIVEDGKIIGSERVGQAFASPRYFNTRPSAAGKGYDANASSGSNLGPTSKALAERITTDIAAQRKAGVIGDVPADLVTASASGLDPDLSPAAALVQVPRIARERGLGEAAVRTLVERSVEQPVLGILGEPHVNVLTLNRQLDRMQPSSRP